MSGGYQGKACGKHGLCFDRDVREARKHDPIDALDADVPLSAEHLIYGSNNTAGRSG